MAEKLISLKKKNGSSGGSGDAVPPNKWNEIYNKSSTIYQNLNQSYTDGVAFTTNQAAYGWSALIGVKGKSTFRCSKNLTNQIIGFASGNATTLTASANTDLNISGYEMLLILCPASGNVSSCSITIS